MLSHYTVISLCNYIVSRNQAIAFKTTSGLGWGPEPAFKHQAKIQFRFGFANAEIFRADLARLWPAPRPEHLRA